MAQSIARISGWVFVLIGVIGFFSGSMTMNAGTELRLFPVNVVHNIVHVLIGVWGLNAGRTAERATAYCKQAGVLFLLLGILGLIPATTAMLSNLVPLGGNGALLHIGLGLILSWFGFVAGTRAVVA